MSTLRITGGTGLTSCLSVRIDQLVKYRNEHHAWPKAIDTRSQFDLYRSEAREDIDALLLLPYLPPKDTTAAPVFDHGHQFAWYDELPLRAIAYLAAHACAPSEAVFTRSRGIQAHMHGRTAVLYRGNDKAKEVAPIPYAMMIDAARQTGATRFWVQTDEQQFLDAFREEFPDTLALDTLPRIQRDHDAFVMPPASRRPAFAVEFLAALHALSRAPEVITTTGNTGLWAMIYRGHTGGVWQAHGQHQQARKLFT